MTSLFRLVTKDEAEEVLEKIITPKEWQDLKDQIDDIYERCGNAIVKIDVEVIGDPEDACSELLRDSRFAIHRR